MCAGHEFRVDIELSASPCNKMTVLELNVSERVDNKSRAQAHLRAKIKDEDGIICVVNFCNSSLCNPGLASHRNAGILLLTILEMENQAGGGKEKVRLGGEILNFISSAKDDRLR